MRLPNGENAGSRISSFTQPEDLQDLSRLLTTTREQVISRYTVNGSSEVAIRTAEWTYLHPLVVPDDDDPRPAKLFSRPDDRWEVNDVYGSHTDIADELAVRVQSLAGGPP